MAVVAVAVAASSETAFIAVGRTVGGTGSMPRARLRPRCRHRQEGEMLFVVGGLNSLAGPVDVAEGLGWTLLR